MSDARQLLRDYAREEVTVTIPDETSGDYEIVVGQRGELAGLTFRALQGILTELDAWQDLNSLPSQKSQEVTDLIGDVLAAIIVVMAAS